MSVEVSDSVKKEYCEYIKPEFGKNGPGNPIVAIGILIFFLFMCIAAWGGGGLLGRILELIVLVWLGGRMIRIYSRAKEEYQRSIESPQMPEYALDFSKSEGFHEDSFRIGDRALYVACGAAPINYEDIQKVSVEVTKSDMETHTFTITLKKSYEEKKICNLPKSAWKPGPEQDQWNEMINRIHSRIQPDHMGLSYDIKD